MPLVGVRTELSLALAGEVFAVRVSEQEGLVRQVWLLVMVWVSSIPRSETLL